jgi:hypothetical protein
LDHLGVGQLQRVAQVGRSSGDWRRNSCIVELSQRVSRMSVTSDHSRLTQTGTARSRLHAIGLADADARLKRSADRTWEDRPDSGAALP